MPLPMPSPASPIPPKLPGAIAGQPMGPGGSPATSPGAGAGQSAAASAAIKAIMPVLHKALSAYEVGSKEYMAVSKATQVLAATFAKPSGSNLVPAAIQQINGAAKTGMPVMNPGAPGMANPGANAQAPGQEAESEAI